MPIIDSLSKIAKSVGDSAASVAKKSGGLVEISKLTAAISSEEDKITTIYTEIGQEAFAKYELGELFPEEVTGLCKKVVEAQENIENIKKKILSLKNEKVCPTCGTSMELDALYCQRCGTKQEVPVIKDEDDDKCEEDDDKPCCCCKEE